MNQLKKVLIFSLDYLPGELGGAEVALQQITDRIDPREIEFHMVTLYYDSTVPRYQKIGNVHIHYVGLFGKPNASMADRKRAPLHYNKHWFQIAAAVKGWQLHRKHRFDAVWGMMAHSTGVPAVIFKWLAPNIPYVLTLQEGDPPEYIERLMRKVWWVWSKCFKKADVVQAISNFLADWAQRRGFAGKRVVIPNAVHVARFDITIPAHERSEIRAEWSASEDDVVLITTSRLVKKNAVDDVIRALLHAPDNVHFAIYGDGPDALMLRALVTELGVTNRVYFGGQVNYDAVPRLLQAADVFIRPSRSEGMGNSFVEAMVAKRPVIATQEGGIADFLFDAIKNPERSATGWAVEVDAPEQIVQAIERIMDDPAARAQTVETAYNLAVAEYDWDLIAKRMQAEVFLPLWQE